MQRNRTAPSLAAFVLLTASILLISVALSFLPDPWSLNILSAQGALNWNDVVLFTGVGVVLVAVASFLFYGFLMQRAD